MTEEALIREGPVVLQSCIMSVETSVTSPTRVIAVKVEDDTAGHIKVEEIPEEISFPPIKTEQDEVSYKSLCILLDTFHQYPGKPAVLHCLISVQQLQCDA